MVALAGQALPLFFELLLADLGPIELFSQSSNLAGGQARADAGERFGRLIRSLGGWRQFLLQVLLHLCDAVLDLLEANLLPLSLGLHHLTEKSVVDRVDNECDCPRIVAGE